MKDTSKEINDYQLKFFLNKSVEERFQLTFQMIDDGKKLVESTIINNNPSISDIELKKETIKRFYRNDFSEAEMNNILNSFK